MTKKNAILRIELKEGQILDYDMNALKLFLNKLSRDDLIDIHNLVVELVNKRLNKEIVL